MQDIRSTAQLRAIEAAIERGDIDGVFQAVRLGREFWAPLDRQINEAFLQGALWQIDQLPKKTGPEGTNLIVRFDQRNPRAEDWTRERAARFVTETQADQRVLIAETVEEGIGEGAGAKRIARRLIGERRGNQRVGGLIGLHSRDARAVRRAREELSDPEAMAAYLRRSNAPWKRSVRSALRRGEPLRAEQIERITRSYADKLLRDRGQRIARTEAHNAFSAGRNESVVQMIESGRIPPDAVTLTWQATISKRTRDTHLAMNGQKVPYGQAFTSPSGAQMMYPGDESLGAPSEELINCRCGVRHEIDFVRLAR
ncbi:MAG: phage minor head protein [Pseudomonadota bacterium]